MSEFPGKIDPTKLSLLDKRIQGTGGVSSSFTPPRSEISCSPSPNVNLSDSVSRLTNDFGDVSQSSCRTLKCGNVQNGGLGAGAGVGGAADHPKDKENTDNVDAIKVVTSTKPGKKKSTPNKRPASAISIGTKKDHDYKSRPRAKSPKLSETIDDTNNLTTHSTTSRDTLLDYFPSTSNPSKNASGSRMSATSPSLPKPAASSSRLSTTSPNVAAKAAGLGSKLLTVSSPVPPSKSAKSTGQKKLDKFFIKTKSIIINNNNNKETKSNQQDQQPKVDHVYPRPLSVTSNESHSSHPSSQLLHDKIASLEKQLAEAKSQNLAIKNNQTMLTLQLQATVKRQSVEMTQLKSQSESRKTKTMDVIESLIREDSIQKSAKLRQKLASDGARLGRLVTVRRGGIHSRAIETWEDGEEPQKLKKKREELRVRREGLERKWRELFESNAMSLSGGETKTTMDDLEMFEAKETVWMHLEEVKREEKKLEEEDRELTLEKRAHVRLLKLVANEDASKFRFRHKLHDRYVPLNILGKGGFSEVWKAYDLVDLQHVAVKIHQLESSWSDAKKENYTKHVSREYEIHREVRHPRIVSLYDVFEIDTDSFATVLECCEGEDLDTILKDRGRLGERDARAILLQVLSGMRYLSTPSDDGKRQGIIHYDLKPGNILFDGEGRAKITDFGLSKIVDTEDLGEGMELTSQGAGTYWYLPPECFLMDQDVRISNKVDVWSIGVIYFQMLFGRRPFGDGESQDKVLRNQTMLNATEVHFPAKPSISEGAKEFIRVCLTYDQMHRPNVSQLCEHDYLRATLQD